MCHCIQEELKGKRWYGILRYQTLTSVRSRLRPSTSSSPAFNSPPGNLKNVVPS